MRLLELMGGTEWAVDPSWYVTNPDHYSDKIEAGRAALESCDADKIVFYWVGEPAGAGFLDKDEDWPEGTAPTLYYYDDLGDREKGIKTPASIVDGSYFEACWEGPHLYVYRDGDAFLYWGAKHVDETLLVQIVSKYALEIGEPLL